MQLKMVISKTLDILDGVISFSEEFIIFKVDTIPDSGIVIALVPSAVATSLVAMKVPELKMKIK